MAVPPTKAEHFAELDAARREDANLPPPRMLVLVGIPGRKNERTGSGKSTFSMHLCDVGWVRVSQDDLGNRRKCELQTVQLLREGRNVVIDRCNFDKSQRKHWVDFAKARGSACGVIVFATSLEVCMTRVRTRKDHPTLKGEEDDEMVVKYMADQFVFPDRTEGFAFCRVIRSEADQERVLTEILTAP
ncbi:P-loop containing nucleoside triphosphate hydrolase [Gracilaria domingensis]|nr:P-loop containing nucleoside triphosphate hydrolase [Gracilaria domingensis]